MCGVAGFISKDRVKNKNHLAIMCNAIQHRGPDGFGYYSEKNVFLGHRLLRIFSDETEAGPYISSDGNYVLSFNGEIYNHDEVKKHIESELKIQWRYHTDSEFFLEGWALEQEKFLKRINGVFAFAIWDKTKNKLFIGRDQLGEKPLYYTSDHGQFMFSSEVKSFKAVDWPMILNTEKMNEYFAYRYTTGHETLFKNVYRVLPGEILEIDSDLHIQRHAFFHLRHMDIYRFQQTDTVEELDDLIRKSIELRRPNKGNASGIFLSGGLDSNLIAQFLPRKTISFTLSNDQEELDQVKKSSHRLDFLSYYLNLQSLNIQDLDQAIWATEEPIGDPIILLTLRLAQAAKNKTKIVFTGDGADEVFAGYIHHLVFQIIVVLKSKFGGGFMQVLAFIVSASPVEIFNFLNFYSQKLNNSAIARLAESIKVYAVSETFSSKMSQLFLFDELKSDRYELESSVQNLRDLLDVDLTTWLPDYVLSRQDKILMSQGIEMRLPYLDLNIVNFSRSIQINQLIKNGSRKYILKQVANKYLPSQDVFQSKKSFTHDFKIHEELKSDILKNPILRDILQQEKVNSKKSDFLENKKLFSLVVFQRWLNMFNVQN
jgi:asparagine synthase (glutamine-hydrolysing)